MQFRRATKKKNAILGLIFFNLRGARCKFMGASCTLCISAQGPLVTVAAAVRFSVLHRYRRGTHSLRLASYQPDCKSAIQEDLSQARWRNCRRELQHGQSINVERPGAA